MTTNTDINNQTTNSTHSFSEEFAMKMTEIIKGFPALTLEDALNDEALCQMVQNQLDEQKRLDEQTVLETARLAKATALTELKAKLLGSTKKLEQELKVVTSRPSDSEGMKKWIVTRQKDHTKAMGVISPAFTFADVSDPSWAIAWRGSLCYHIKKLQDLGRVFQDSEENKKKLSFTIAMVQSYIEAITVVLTDMYKISDLKGLRSKYNFKELDYKLYEDTEKYQVYTDLLKDVEVLAENLKKELANPQPSMMQDSSTDSQFKFGGTPPPVSAPRRRSGKKEKKVHPSSTVDETAEVGRAVNEK